MNANDLRVMCTSLDKPLNPERGKERRLYGQLLFYCTVDDVPSQWCAPFDVDADATPIDVIAAVQAAAFDLTRVMFRD